MKISDFDYYLPPELIAQTPIEPRDYARLMVLNRGGGSIAHHHFFELIDWLRAGDVLVFNDSRVIPARLNGQKTATGGRLEILLLRRLRANVWETLVKPARRATIGSQIEISNGSTKKPTLRIMAEVVELGEGGMRVISFADETQLTKLGRVPLPPYIHSPLQDVERYQTVYAREVGSVAAPTAGLHFTSELMAKIKDLGISCLFVTLHIGLDTFQPIGEDNPLEHAIHKEYGVLSAEVAEKLSQAKAAGRRIIAVGTTTARLVEAVTQLSHPTRLRPLVGWISLYILPGYRFQMVDALITNFHLPRSTLLLLVSAFAGKGLIGQAYQAAIDQKYRFYSFGDAMLIL
ncbi:MAG: tRNA preQ1(34) S-adenosylmethionine ribosyltransferase-isomerase QueA [Dehalococcoidia bacterium]|nr:MAG: tRNA preQ1(34) S-adenosylmethionine ribosyltransferase-isomerase QueA [Dehalococcoidia bacterium]